MSVERDTAPRQHTRHRPDGVSLLIRNLPNECRPDDVRRLFERYGEVKDVYLPRDFHTQRPKGFGFIEFIDPRDADEAIYGLDGTLVGGRRVEVVHSKQARKTPREMREREVDEPAPKSGGRAGSARPERDAYERRGGRDSEYGRRDTCRSRSRSRSKGGSRRRSRSGGRRRSNSRRRSSSRSRSGSRRGRSSGRGRSRSASRGSSPARRRRSLSRERRRSSSSGRRRRRSGSRQRARSASGSPRRRRSRSRSGSPR